MRGAAAASCVHGSGVATDGLCPGEPNSDVFSRRQSFRVQTLHSADS